MVLGCNVQFPVLCCIFVYQCILADCASLMTFSRNNLFIKNKIFVTVVYCDFLNHA